MEKQIQYKKSLLIIEPDTLTERVYFSVKVERWRLSNVLDGPQKGAMVINQAANEHE